ncbi:MAG: adenylosuccinate synthase, partial [Proteobacteria bacterium]|nr:adenylosuccinate synthase [Pseudomonadota bacterium]
MSVDVVLGLQWGDEGKGKIVDKLSNNADVVVRFQGGANAGHTVWYKGNEIKLHLIPSGIIHRDTICLIGNGVVFDPEIFAEEVSVLNGYGIKCPGKLFISKRAHLVFPFHKQFDAYFEDYKGKGSIGTTKRGIGPAYTDKFRRMGIRVGDLYNDALFNERLRRLIDYYNKIFIDVFGGEPINFRAVRNHFVNYKNMLKRYVKDTEEMLYDFQKEGKKILMEGAQA